MRVGQTLIRAATVLWAIASAMPCHAITLAPIFGEHMVLQRDRPIVLWGQAAPGEQISAQLGPRQAVTTANSNGRWGLRLEALPAGGPHSLTIKGAASNTLNLGDILVGDVWLSSGQSNMEFRLKEAKGGAAAVATAATPALRFYNIAHAAATAPLDTLSGADGIQGWHMATASGDNQTALELYSAVAYFFGARVQAETAIPIGLINAAWGNTAIEAWTPREGFRGHVPPPAIPDHPDPSNPTQLYNGMIHPLQHFGIKGFIWYQGEANFADRGTYKQKMEHLIASWRHLFGDGELPFYYVQLAPYNYDGDGDALPEFWEAQAKVQGTMNATGMVVINDVGDLNDILPKDKRTVGERLARWALAKTYDHESLAYRGPAVSGLRLDGTQLVLTFEFAGAGLVTRDGQDPTWFEVAGDNRVWLPARAHISGKDTITLSHPNVAAPRFVRFAWSKIAEPNLANSAGLPAGAFRID